MEITYDNIFDLVVNSRTVSRKEKQLAITRFLKEKSGEQAPQGDEEVEIVKKLKDVRKLYILRAKSEK